MELYNEAFASQDIFELQTTVRCVGDAKTRRMVPPSSEADVWSLRNEQKKKVAAIVSKMAARKNPEKIVFRPHTWQEGGHTCQKPEF